MATPRGKREGSAPLSGAQRQPASRFATVCDGLRNEELPGASHAASMWAITQLQTNEQTNWMELDGHDSALGFFHLGQALKDHLLDNLGWHLLDTLAVESASSASNEYEG